MVRRWIPPVLTIVATTVLVGGVAASASSPLVLTVDAPGQLSAGEEGELRLILCLQNPWYIYAPTGVNEAQGMIETRVQMRRHDQVQFTEAEFPKAEASGTFAVLAGENIVVRQPFRVRPRVPEGEYRVRGAVEYQACDGEICLPPNRVEFSVVLNIR